MKKSFRILAMVMAIVLAIGVNAGGVSAKTIYFAGEYSSSRASIYLNQYSSIEGKAYGNFTINVPHAYGAYRGELIKIGANKYRSKDKGLIFTVSKKKVKVKIVKKKKYGWEIGGTYKQYKKYPRP